MRDEVQIVDSFNSLLVDYLNTFNYIELNVGLCISHLDPLGIEESYKRLEKMSFERKLEKLLELTDSIETGDLHAWCKEAHEKRIERNMYLHGQWQCLPIHELCVEFSIAPWMREKYSDIYPGNRLSIEHLNFITSDLKACFRQLQDLRHEHGI